MKKLCRTNNAKGADVAVEVGFRGSDNSGGPRGWSVKLGWGSAIASAWRVDLAVAIKEESRQDERGSRGYKEV